ncbi:guanylate kinase [Alkalibaculum sp. M08DMB]|uniref:Guanylate kinase n=1 Tax=Alkalibaculum sporogenes TaxID=2655001 RepID=A0A6A7K786_9FIRM|nr:guanylate kinase [Alkalibaculum sporogenes]MPW25348.1 guanylate kinase [Alkalibaculum sporogenes]
MGKIFVLMGKSSTGKDSIFKVLKEDSDLNLIPIITTTTRPIRNDETDGDQYFFIKYEKLIEYESKGKIIEKRKYDTTQGTWYYATIDDGQIDLSLGNYVLISTLEAYKKIQSYFGSENVIPIYIDIKDDIRLERAIIRERQETNPNYNELCRRFLADNVDFSIENLKDNNIIRHYRNYSLNETITEIKKDMLSFI